MANSNSLGPLLHIAVAENDVAMVLYYLLSGCNVNVKENAFGRTPLHVSVRHDNIKMARILLNCGAAIDEMTNDKLTALHIAVSNRSKIMVAILLKYNVNVNPMVNFLDKTPLYMAVEYGCLEIVRMLLDCGASVSKATRRNSTLLHVAVRISDIKMTHLILNNIDHNILETKDIQCKTPLDLALELNNDTIVKMLMKQIMDIQERQNKKKWRHQFKNWKNEKIVELLLRNGKRIPVPELSLSTRKFSRRKYYMHYMNRRSSHWMNE